LTSESTTIIRSQEEQLPDTLLKRDLLVAVYDYFKDAPVAFEAFAARIFQMHDQRVIIDEITRASVDGGRDSVEASKQHRPIRINSSAVARPCSTMVTVPQLADPDFLVQVEAFAKIQ
jgi:hypothetical protein